MKKKLTKVKRFDICLINFILMKIDFFFKIHIKIPNEIPNMNN
jgi:hypothetical protein